MFQRLRRAMSAMEFEEKILHIGLLISFVSLFFPWLTGGSYGEGEFYGNGFSFRTGFIGHAVLIIDVFVLCMVLSPLLGGPILIRKSIRMTLRLFLLSISTALLIGAMTVLLRLTFEVSGAEVRFGVYSCMAGSILALLYAFLRYQEERQQDTRELFRHPDEQVFVSPSKKVEPEPEVVPPPPPPPPPEDHRFSPS